MSNDFGKSARGDRMTNSFNARKRRKEVKAIKGKKKEAQERFAERQNEKIREASHKS